MHYYVYLIVSKSKDRSVSYVGYTNNLTKRITNHNSSKGAKFTRGRKWKLAYSKRYLSKSVAMREEYKLKKNIKFRNKIKLKFKKNENFNITPL